MGGGFDIIKSEICGEDRSCIIYYIQILTTAIGTDNDGEGETETDDLFVIVGGEGANSPDGELGNRCHDFFRKVKLGRGRGEERKNI